MTNDYGVEIQCNPQLCTIPLEEYESLKRRIAELESQLENVQASMYAKNVDANMSLIKANERIKELEAALKKECDFGQHIARCADHDIEKLTSENARLKAQVPKWHDFYKDPPKKYKKVIVYFLNHQGWSMQEASIQDDGWRPKFMRSELPQKWCYFPPRPTEESSATDKENG